MARENIFKTVSGRGKQIDAAVEKAAPPSPVVVERSNVPTRVRVQPSSYAPSAPKQSSYGSPMGVEAPQPESQAERAARGQRNPGN